MVAVIQPGAKLGPIGHIISFMANWPPWVFYGSYTTAHLWPQPSFVASDHILPSFAFLANFHLTNPQAFTLDFGPGGFFCLPGVPRGPSHHPWLWATPFHWGGLGLNGLFGPFRPPTAPMACGPRSVGQLGPFWPNPMRPKGGNHLAPKARWVPNHNWTHLSQNWSSIPWTQNWPKDLLDTTLAINPVGPIFGHGPPWTNISAMGSGSHQISSVSLCLSLWGILSIPSYHPYLRLQAWCIYGIIYHYAPFFLRNPMVTFSGPISTFQYQGLKLQCPFQRRLIHIQDYSKGPIIKRYQINAISCQGIKYCILLGQLNSSIQASFNQPVGP
ncbi:hypothetical protein O181_127675 [Austropuccinia psidii MF-1]|uniref:Uncharacterized protein n=1 Tax=Austropuccinia psidii MF-1 TaxID=1389203 RepID=A0A9Q3Q897_9BASI|nr:hypothetical protein [Austropuccinia psidii MF-1]